MKTRIIAGLAVLGIAASSQAYASCNTFISSLSQRIQNNGVPAHSFTLQALPAAQAHQAAGKIVGNCNNGTRLVVYTRGHASASTTSESDSGSTATQPSGKGTFQGGIKDEGNATGSSDTPPVGDAPNEAVQSADDH